MLLAAFISFFLSIATVLFITPRLIERIKARDLLGKDMNKVGNPRIPEIGGLSVFFGFSLGLVAALFAFSYLHIIDLNITLILAAFCTIALVAVIGFVDDLLGWKSGIKQWQHALMPVFAALPLMAVKINNPAMNIPFIGPLPTEIMIPVFGYVSFGLFYSLFFVPAGVTGASNAANMLAGFNGLEAGLGALIHGSILIVSLYLGIAESAVISAAVLGGLLGFLRFNWFPAKIFGGDSLTLLYGAAAAAAVIVGDMEKIGILLFSLFFVELLFKARHGFKSECFGLPQEDGTLKASPNGGSLTHWVMRQGKFTEKQVTQIILGMQTAICLVVLSLVYFKWMVV